MSCDHEVVALAAFDRWLRRVNALLLASWLGMVAARWPGAVGDAPAPHAQRGPLASPTATYAAATADQPAEGDATAERPGPGSSRAAIPPPSRWAPPLEAVATVTSRFGPRDGRWHHGVDLAVPEGTPVRTVWQGVVTHAGWRGAYGLAVEVVHPGGWSTLYGHLASVVVEPGQRVERGQRIGRVGATGNATGSHLHLEVRVAGGFHDPLAWLDPSWYRGLPATAGGAGRPGAARGDGGAAGGR
ncbi:MAG TPA: peptidoglycan DD-metalloendopeptidase family protein [Thermaerobacter sp.]